MVGNKLFLLLKALSKSDRHKLLKKCRHSEDKRHKELYRLITEFNGSEKKHIKCLKKIEIELNKKIEDDSNKVLRRFIDFSIQNIENQIIESEISNNQTFKYHTLSKLFKNSEHKTLHHVYNKKLTAKFNSSNEPKGHYFESTIDDRINILSKSHHQKDMKEWWSLVSEKYSIDNKAYLEKISKIYEQASISYLVDKTYGTSLLSELMNNRHISLLMQIFENSSQTIEIKLAEARFNFENYKESTNLLNEIEEEFYSLHIEDEQTKLELDRKISFFKFLHHFHYNHTIAEIKEINAHLINQSKEYNRIDSLSHFYRMVILTAENPNVNISEEIEKVKTHFTIDNSTYLIDFVKLVHSFLNDEHKAAFQHSNKLSGSSNPYVRIWSILIEVGIHFINEKHEACDVLIERSIRILNIHKNKPYTIASSAKLLLDISQEIDRKPNQLLINLSEKFTKHAFVSQIIIEKIKTSHRANRIF